MISSTHVMIKKIERGMTYGICFNRQKSPGVQGQNIIMISIITKNERNLIPNL